MNNYLKTRLQILDKLLHNQNNIKKFMITITAIMVFTLIGIGSISLWQPWQHDRQSKAAYQRVKHRLSLAQKKQLAYRNTQKILAAAQSRHPEAWRHFIAHPPRSLISDISQSLQNSHIAIQSITPKNVSNQGNLITANIKTNFLSFSTWLSQFALSQTAANLKKIRIHNTKSQTNTHPGKAQSLEVQLILASQADATLPDDSASNLARLSTTTPIASMKDPFKNPIKIRQPNIAKNSFTLQTALIPVYYAKSSDLAKFIANKKMNFLSPQGQIEADPHSNKLWIKDTATHVTALKQLIKNLDQPGGEVVIKTHIVHIDVDALKALGLSFNTSSSQNTTATENASAATLSAVSTDSITVPIIKLHNANFLNLQINALQKNGRAQLISDPELITLNRQTATIESGEELPYQQATTSGATSIAFKKAVLRVKVTPVILPKQQVLLHIDINQDKVSTLTVHGAPTIQTQRLSTQAVIANGATLILGGIIEKADDVTQSGIPILDKIPGIGHIFTQRQHERKKRELLIFITPEILNLSKKSFLSGK